jgi:hypothetical protein
MRRASTVQRQGPATWCQGYVLKGYVSVTYVTQESVGACHDSSSVHLLTSAALVMSFSAAS